METKIKESGRTVRLVSHNIRQVERLCNRVVLLVGGRVHADGAPTDVCQQFYQLSNMKIKDYVRTEQVSAARVVGSGEVELLSIDLLDDRGEPVSEIVSRAAFRARIRFRVLNRISSPELIVGTHTTDFVYLTSGSTVVFPDRPDLDEGEHEIQYILPYFPMAAGEYCIRFSVFDKHRRTIFEGETLKTFSVVEPGGRHASGGWWTLNLPTEWKLGDRRFEAPSWSCG
jgi:hypothetical protein